jgi:outer membrane protein assembly factor BamE (lipoprotein component of BamABCDE complex)
MNNAVSKVLVVCLLGLLMFAATGCQTAQSPNTNTTTAATTDPLTATNKYGLSLRDAQDKSLKLEPGMTQDEVALLLCKPDETSVETFGAQTSRPWNGFTWAYHWGPRIWWLNGKNPHNTLTIIFEKKLDNWVVNTWIWSGPP